jgi:hypothetical protein
MSGPSTQPSARAALPRDCLPRALRAFRRRVVFGAGLAGACAAAFRLGLVVAVGLLVWRWSGGAPVPFVFWAAPLAVLAVACGVFAARRARWTEAHSAAHLDRRLSAAGLLLAAAEGVAIDDVHAAALAARLAGVRAALPALHSGPVALRAALAIGCLALVAAWSPVPTKHASTAAAARLEALADVLAGLDVPALVREQLAERHEELRQRAADGDEDLWRAVDAFDAAMRREQQLARLAQAADPSRAAGGSAEAARRNARLQQLAGDVAKGFAELMRDGDLAKRIDFAALGEALGPAMEAAAALAEGLDLEAVRALLPDDPAALAGLAKVVGEALRQNAAAGVTNELGDRLRAAARELADGQRSGGERGGAAGEGAGAAGGADGSPTAGAGAGTEGGGHVALTLRQAAAGAPPEAFLPLPTRAGPGAGEPGASGGVARAEPTVEPGAGNAPVGAPVGGSSAAGATAPTDTLRFLPRHRAVVQRYFTGGGDERK